MMVLIREIIFLIRNCLHLHDNGLPIEYVAVQSVDGGQRIFVFDMLNIIFIFIFFSDKSKIWNLKN